jgi:hypothetical protein
VISDSPIDDCAEVSFVYLKPVVVRIKKCAVVLTNDSGYS